ncbi:MAG TPA: UdgX family uracil-DNA binding protein [Devosia sp.]
MRSIRLEHLNDFDEWRGVARALLLSGTSPDECSWSDVTASDGLFDAHDEISGVTRRAVGTVPPRFIELAQSAICHSDPERFALLYRLLWRLQKDKALLEARSDPDVGKLERRASAVRRDSHKMKAFIRFKELAEEDRFAAWFEPEHYILERTAPFFVRRFAGMHWAIVTPYASAFWDKEKLTFGPGGSKLDVPADDALDDVWRTYFSSIFNPARLKISMMKSEMPVKYWRNLPEATIIPDLIRTAKERENEMIERMASQPPARHLRQVERQEPEELHEIKTLADARSAVQGCTRCPLYEHATQAVFGEGPPHAEIMFVGEQPGDNEDLEGRPFVGPAGQVFDRAMKKLGFSRRDVYVTNAVKHFKFVPRGKRRIHQKPDAGEVQACRFWLNLEREFVKPRLIVAMGATAVRGVLGKAATISSLRGKPLELDDGTVVLATVHPSYLLRLPDRDQAAVELERFEADLKLAQTIADGLSRRQGSRTS